MPGAQRFRHIEEKLSLATADVQYAKLRFIVALEPAAKRGCRHQAGHVVNIAPVFCMSFVKTLVKFAFNLHEADMLANCFNLVNAIVSAWRRIRFCLSDVSEKVLQDEMSDATKTGMVEIPERMVWSAAQVLESNFQGENF